MGEQDVMDMALDDIITVTKKGKRGGGAAAAAGRGKPRREQNKPYGKPANTGGALFTRGSKIIVSNLGFHVKSTDIKEIFSASGPITKVDLNCDEHGKSKGVATVEYRHSEDASKAAKTYHERTLDGRAMKIEVVVNAGAARAMQQSSHRDGPRDGGRREGGRDAARGGKRGGRGGKREGRPEKVVKTTAELDAEMDTFMKDEEMVVL